jgi:hypothetical protein
MDTHTITVGGKRWRLVYAPIRSHDGSCDPPTNTGKTIRIASSLRRTVRPVAEAIIHEVLHAGLWALTEETVEEIARDLARILDREGCLKSPME